MIVQDRVFKVFSYQLKTFCTKSVLDAKGKRLLKKTRVMTRDSTLLTCFPSIRFNHRGVVVVQKETRSRHFLLVWSHGTRTANLSQDLLFRVKS